MGNAASSGARQASAERQQRRSSRLAQRAAKRKAPADDEAMTRPQTADQSRLSSGAPMDMDLPSRSSLGDVSGAEESSTAGKSRKDHSKTNRLRHRLSNLSNRFKSTGKLRDSSRPSTAKTATREPQLQMTAVEPAVGTSQATAQGTSHEMPVNQAQMQDTIGDISNYLGDDGLLTSGAMIAQPLSSSDIASELGRPLNAPSALPDQPSLPYHQGSPAIGSSMMNREGQLDPSATDTTNQGYSRDSIGAAAQDLRTRSRSLEALRSNSSAGSVPSSRLFASPGSRAYGRPRPAHPSRPDTPDVQPLQHDDRRRPPTHRAHSTPMAPQRPVARRASRSMGDNVRSRMPEPGEVISALPGEDQAGMLSRLLSVAAAATAASLVGRDDPNAATDGVDIAAHHAATSAATSTGTSTPATVTESSAPSRQPTQGDLVDGSFDGFLAALQSGQLAQALRNGGSTLGGGQAEDGSHQPLNFFRMFRFNSPVHIEGAPAPAEGGGRLVPIIIVGIRSVPPRHDPVLNGQRDANAPPVLAPVSNQTASAPLLPVEPTRLHATQMHPEPGSQFLDESVFDADPPGVHYLTTNRPEVNDIMAALESNPGDPPTAPEIATESPIRSRRASDGPAPGAAAPERPNLLGTVMGRLRSFAGEASTGNSQASGTTSPAESASIGSTSPTRRSRIRRPQWRPFGSSSNPVQLPARDGPAASEVPQTRSWIIYVLGGTYPENHPILTTPSLFTDAPTYEDMMLLGSLIGPARPDTVAHDDIERAGPTFELNETHADLANRCLICLSDYEIGETCRQLSKCSHVYHRDCIDTWLTTGRNSCPLCRSTTAAKNAPMTGMPPAPNPHAGTGAHDGDATDTDVVTETIAERSAVAGGGLLNSVSSPGNVVEPGVLMDVEA